MRTLPATAFAALLARAAVSQAGFARLAGLSSRQVNNWCRGRAAVPRWAAALAVLLEVHSPEAITLLVDEAAPHLARHPRRATRRRHRHRPSRGGRPTPARSAAPTPPTRRRGPRLTGVHRPRTRPPHRDHPTERSTDSCTAEAPKD